MQITRAERISLAQEIHVTVRNPVAVWLLGIVTLGILTVVWTYQVTRELRDYSRSVTRPFAASPVLAAILAAAWPLAFVPGMIGAFANGRRIRTVQRWVESPSRVSAIVASLLFPLLFLHSFYLQRALNDVWRRAAEGRGPPPDYTVATGQQSRLARQAEQDSLGRDRWR